MTRNEILRRYAAGERYFSGADLRGADISGANLRGADLRGADLRGADISGANLRWADLRGADISWADLRWADLRGADISGAYISGANLIGADFSGANFVGADLAPGSTRIPWQSHDLLSEILWRAAGDSEPRRLLAAYIGRRRDWCWAQWAAWGHPERAWALRELRRWVCDGDDAPELVRAVPAEVAP